MQNLNRFSGSGTFLRQEDVPRPLQLTIARTGEHQFEGKSAQLVLHWQQPGVKPLICNTTNVRLLISLFGAQTDQQLIGKTIEVYTDPTVTMRGQVVGGLRVRLPTTPPATQPAVAQSTAPTPQTSVPQTPVPSSTDSPW